MPTDPQRLSLPGHLQLALRDHEESVARLALLDHPLACSGPHLEHALHQLCPGSSSSIISFHPSLQPVSTSMICSFANWRKKSFFWTASRMSCLDLNGLFVVSLTSLSAPTRPIWSGAAALSCAGPAWPAPRTPPSSWPAPPRRPGQAPAAMPPSAGKGLDLDGDGLATDLLHLRGQLIRPLLTGGGPRGGGTFGLKFKKWPINGTEQMENVRPDSATLFIRIRCRSGL